MSITTATLVANVELGPLERKNNCVYISEVVFDDPVSFSLGDKVTLRDVDGSTCEGEVVGIEPGKLSPWYKVRF